jgi:hypothetical protein
MLSICIADKVLCLTMSPSHRPVLTCLIASGMPYAFSPVEKVGRVISNSSSLEKGKEYVTATITMERRRAGKVFILIFDLLHKVLEIGLVE